MKNIFKLSILLIFCMFMSINSYGENKMESNIDFKKIANDIRKKNQNHLCYYLAIGENRVLMFQNILLV